jgi:carboxymethylenebutenolidase
MCNERTEKDIKQYRRSQGLTRRDFNAVLSTAAIAAMLPAVANASEVRESEVMVTTPDGQADCYLVHPTEGSHAGVVMWPDIKGIRPAFRMMGKLCRTPARCPRRPVSAMGVHSSSILTRTHP